MITMKDIKNTGWRDRDNAIEAYKIFESDMTYNGSKYEIGVPHECIKPIVHDPYSIYRPNTMPTDIGDIAFEQIGWALAYSDIPIPMMSDKNKYIIAKVLLYGNVKRYYEVPNNTKHWFAYDKDGEPVYGFDDFGPRNFGDISRAVQYYLATTVEIVELVNAPQMFMYESFKHILTYDVNYLNVIGKHNPAVYTDQVFMANTQEFLNLDNSPDLMSTLPPEYVAKENLCPDIISVNKTLSVRVGAVQQCLIGDHDLKTIKASYELQKALIAVPVGLWRPYVVREFFDWLEHSKDRFRLSDPIKGDLNLGFITTGNIATYLEEITEEDVVNSPLSSIFDTTMLYYHLGNKPEDLAFINKYQDAINWHDLTASYRYIDKVFYEHYKDKIDDDLLCSNGNITSDLIYYLRTTGRINGENILNCIYFWKQFPVSYLMKELPDIFTIDSIFNHVADNNVTITADFINKYWYRFTKGQWRSMCADGLVSEDLALKYAHCIDWTTFGTSTDLSKAFINQNWDKLGPMILAGNYHIYRDEELLNRSDIKNQILKNAGNVILATMQNYEVVPEALYNLLLENKDKLIHQIYGVYRAVCMSYDYKMIDQFKKDFGDLYYWKNS